MIEATDIAAAAIPRFRCGHARTPENSYSNGRGRDGEQKVRCKECTSAREKDALAQAKRARRPDQQVRP